MFSKFIMNWNKKNIYMRCKTDCLLFTIVRVLAFNYVIPYSDFIDLPI